LSTQTIPRKRPTAVHGGPGLDALRTLAVMRRLILPMAAIACLIAAAVALVACGSSGEQRAAHSNVVGGGLVGVMFDGPVLTATVSLDEQLDTAVANGVESLRIAVDWSALQPYRASSDVPPADRSQFQTIGGVPTRLSALDRIVGSAAKRGLSLLPVVDYTPSWDAQHPGSPASPPKSATPFAAFLTALVGRYGPLGTFWSAHPGLPRVPIRMWQIWNEPHFVSYWSEQPFAPSYVKLLAVSRAALKSADPGAKLVLAGLADFSWNYLDDIYRVPGASRLFDIVAIHPYTERPSGVITILQRARAVMDRFGDAQKPILATEITWPSSQGKAAPQFGVSTTESQQAQRLAQLMPLLAANRATLGLMGFYWYTWMGDETPRAAAYGFDYAGLLKYVNGAVAAKPALSTFKRGALAIEGCRRKASAASCAT
jgi:hypothetical protein